jgi:hypothetical protein
VAQAVLKDVLEDLETKSIRLADAEDYIVYSGNEVLLLENNIKRLTRDLEAKKHQLEAAEADADKALKKIDYYFEVIAGTGIRCLNQHMLSYVFGYLKPSANIITVCKYWKWTLLACKDKPVITAQKASPFEKLRSRSSDSITSKSHHGEAIMSPPSSTVKRPPNISIPGSAAAQSSPPNALTSSRGMPRQRHDYEEDTSLLTAVTKTESVFLHKPKRSPKATDAAGFNSGRNRPSPRQDYDSHVQVTAAVPGTGEDAAPKQRRSKGDTVSSRAASAAVGAQEQVTFKNKSAAQGERRPKSQEQAAPAPTAAVSTAGASANPDTADKLKLPKVAEGKESKRTTARKPAEFTRLKNSNPHQPVLRQPQPQQSGISDWREPGRGSGWSPQKASVVPNEGPVYDDFEDEVVTGEMERSMIKEVMKMRSDQQLANLIEYVQAGCSKIEDLESEKRRLKKIFRAWNLRYEKIHGKEATIKDKKSALTEQYQEYETVSAFKEYCYDSHLLCTCCRYQQR